MIEVREGRLGTSVFAAKALHRGQVILTGWGPCSSVRTRHSIQVDQNTHVTIDTPIQFFNHSCEPNCGFLIRRGVAMLEVHPLRPIEAGEELTVDYATFEDHIEHLTGSCLCGTPSCRGQISGYDGLPEHRREALWGYVAEHLQDRDAVVCAQGDTVDEEAGRTASLPSSDPNDARPPGNGSGWTTGGQSPSFAPLLGPTKSISGRSRSIVTSLFSIGSD